MILDKNVPWSTSCKVPNFSVSQNEGKCREESFSLWHSDSPFFPHTSVYLLRGTWKCWSASWAHTHTHTRGAGMERGLVHLLSFYTWTQEGSQKFIETQVYKMKNKASLEFHYLVEILGFSADFFGCPCEYNKSFMFCCGPIFVHCESVLLSLVNEELTGI